MRARYWSADNGANPLNFLKVIRFLQETSFRLVNTNWWHMSTRIMVSENSSQMVQKTKMIWRANHWWIEMKGIQCLLDWSLRLAERILQTRWPGYSEAHRVQDSKTDTHRGEDQAFGLCGSRQGWDGLRGSTETRILPCVRQTTSPSSTHELGPPKPLPWGSPKGRRGLRGDLWLTHADAWQKPPQPCEMISLQLK